MSTEDLTDALKTLRFAMEHHVELLKRANATIRGMKRLVVCIGKIADSPDEENEWDAVEKYKSIRLLAQNELKKWSGE